VHAVDPEAQVRIELARQLVHIESKAAHAFALGRAIREAGYTPSAPDVTHVSARPGAGSGGCAQGGCGCA
jgi:hypothetical protein